MRFKQACALSFFVVLPLMAAAPNASAQEALAPVHGAWVAQSLSCDDVFKKEGGKTTFQKLDSTNTGAFIIDGNSVKSQRIACRVTRSSRTGAIISLQLECQDNMMVSTEELELRQQPDGTLLREFKGFSGFTQTLKRCPGF